jgi:hypothetical protein
MKSDQNSMPTLTSSPISHIRANASAADHTVKNHANPVALAQSPKSHAKARASINAYHKETLMCQFRCQCCCCCSSAISCRAKEQNRKDKSHFLLTFEVVEELGDLLQIAELRPGEAGSGLSLAEKLLDVGLDVREHLPDVLQVLAAVGDGEVDGVLALGDLAGDAEEADEVHARVSAIHHDGEVAEDDLVVFEELAAAVVELEKPGEVFEVG